MGLPNWIPPVVLVELVCNRGALRLLAFWVLGPVPLLAAGGTDRDLLQFFDGEAYASSFVLALTFSFSALAPICC